jgi:hypothetical protein
MRDIGRGAPVSRTFSHLLERSVAMPLDSSKPRGVVASLGRMAHGELPRALTGLRSQGRLQRGLTDGSNDHDDAPRVRKPRGVVAYCRVAASAESEAKAGSTKQCDGGRQSLRVRRKLASLPWRTGTHPTVAVPLCLLQRVRVTIAPAERLGDRRARDSTAKPAWRRTSFAGRNARELGLLTIGCPSSS